jgi:hypothetical protein
MLHKEVFVSLVFLSSFCLSFAAYTPSPLGAVMDFFHSL